MPKQRPLADRIAEQEQRLQRLKQQQRVQKERERLREMTPRRARSARRAAN